MFKEHIANTRAEQARMMAETNRAIEERMLLQCLSACMPYECIDV